MLILVLTKFLISVGNPSIYSEDVHMKCIQETELQMTCQKAMQYIIGR